MISMKIILAPSSLEIMTFLTFIKNLYLNFISKMIEDIFMKII